MNNQEYIKNIKQSLKSNGYTYKDLAEKSGIPLQTIKNYLSGKTLHPRNDTYIAINDALNKMIPDAIFTLMDKNTSHALDYICENITSHLSPDLLRKNIILEIHLTSIIYNIINERKETLSIEDIDSLIDLLNMLKKLKSNHSE